VDGAPAALERADEMLLGVELEAGEHEVFFVYREPPYIAVTRVMSGLAALVLLVASVWNPKVPLLGEGTKHAA